MSILTVISDLTSAPHVSPVSPETTLKQPTLSAGVLGDEVSRGTVAQPDSAAEPHRARAQTKVHRPWGWYDSLDTGEGGTGHQVKRIHVNAGGSLSLQSHAQRAEHWVVVQGRATIGIGPAANAMVENDYQPGQYVYIPLGALHRLSNRTSSPVEIIEVQCGGYLGEDDIVRYEDVYGRV
jgi:mannose-1-phosphate guanylyltransferase / mannose-6-phosphate isomerase